MSKTPSKLLAVAQSLYPCKDTLDEAVSHSLALLPITEANVLTSVLMTYHNTLLSVATATELQDKGWRTNKGDKILPDDLPLDTLVEVKFRDSSFNSTHFRKDRAGAYSWKAGNDWCDILEYRIVEGEGN